MRHLFPQNKPARAAASVIKTLHRAGFEAYLVGGCVRDLLMGKEPDDYDVVTSAPPDAVEELFPRTKPIGKQFGIMLVIEQGVPTEVATFRSDSAVSDGRRPAEVVFASAKEDVLRRDFTINALLYNPEDGEVVDFVGGKQDLANRCLRCIGKPEQRLREDYLRLLRAVRFKTTLQFAYDPGLKVAIQRSAHRIHTVAAERIRLELNKILASPHRHQGVDELLTAGMLHVLLPEVAACRHVPQPYAYHQEGDVYNHLLLCLRSLPKSAPLYVTWAVLLHDIGKVTTFSSEGDRIHFDGHAEESVRLAAEIAKRFRFSRRERDKMLWLIQHHMTMGQILSMRRVKQHALLTHELFPALLQVFRADIGGSRPRDYSLYRDIRKLYREEQMYLLAAPTWFVNGQDIMDAFSLPPSEQVGKLLHLAKEAQLHKQVTSKEETLAYLKGYLRDDGNG